MIKLIALTALLFSNVVFASSSNENCVAITKEKLCIQIEWTQGPYVGSFSRNIVRFKNLLLSTEEKEVYNSPKESVQFFGWMLMHGHSHGTRPVSTKLESDGIYENSKIFYMQGMKGSWQFKLKLGSEEFVLHTLDV
ncbi:hypothetical protein [Halobacteriovorax sp. HLS]|uniref:hypothetical protein n=1 Tax=Halobacteriovorax sp. HLS TaxID=2234000 RepID=UPI000FD7ED8B|nr:hypothetical protein [Halobacteriovorax sp. HLS]